MALMIKRFDDKEKSMEKYDYNYAEQHKAHIVTFIGTRAALMRYTPTK